MSNAITRSFSTIHVRRANRARAATDNRRKFWSNSRRRVWDAGHINGGRWNDNARSGPNTDAANIFARRRDYLSRGRCGWRWAVSAKWNVGRWDVTRHEWTANAGTRNVFARRGSDIFGRGCNRGWPTSGDWDVNGRTSTNGDAKSRDRLCRGWRISDERNFYSRKCNCGRRRNSRRAVSDE